MTFAEFASKLGIPADELLQMESGQVPLDARRLSGALMRLAPTTNPQQSLNARRWIGGH